MGGSGGGGFFTDRSPDQVRSELRKEEEKTLDQQFDVRVAAEIGNILEEANSRNIDATTRALEDVKTALEREIEGSVDPRFGGSVRKHTYVDGISDVDTLLVLRDPELKSKTPLQVLDYLERK